jgi:hypothetical protein
MANDMHTDGRDIRNGTYDAISPTGKKQPGLQIRENPTPLEGAQHGADVRSEPMPGTEDPIPQGLRERKEPLNAQTGRRPAD